MPAYGYRSHKDPHIFVKLLRNKKLSILIGSVLLALILITFSNKGILQRISLERELESKKQHTQALRLEINQLKTLQKQLTTDRSKIEHVAREAHGMVKPGEIVYRIIPATNADKK